jgi:hypothetical protein
VDILGFPSLVEEARRQLRQSSSAKGPVGDLGWADKFNQAVWTIMDLCQIQAQDEPFVRNAIRFGLDQAMETGGTPNVRILIPEIPARFFPRLSLVLAKLLWPQDVNERWLESKENGQPSGAWVSRPGELTRGINSAPARAVVIRGQGILALLARHTGPRILMDVTTATQTEIIKAIREVSKLRKELNIKPYSVKRGPGTNIPEANALDAALRREKGESILEIAQSHGWPISYEDNPSGSSPTTVDYIRKGRHIQGLLRAFEQDVNG